MELFEIQDTFLGIMPQASAGRLRVGIENLVSMKSSIPMRGVHPQGVQFL